MPHAFSGTAAPPAARPPAWLGRAAALLVAAGLSLPFAPVRAADPQPYTVTIAATGERALDAALAQASELVALRRKAPVGPFGLVIRARQDVGRLETVLHSFGYYEGKVTIRLAGHRLGNRNLVAILDKVPQGVSVAAAVAVQPGPLFRLGRVKIKGTLPAGLRGKLGLSPGQPAVAAAVLAAGARLERALQEEGYALAKVAPPVAVAHPRQHVLDIVFTVQAGRRAYIGPIVIRGLKTVSESFVRRSLPLHAGELYRPSRIERARRELAALGVFSGIAVHTGDRIGPNGRIPVIFDLQERPRHAVAVTGAYSTDLGFSLSTRWSDRNLFGQAERLDLSAAGAGLFGSAVKGLGYNLSARLTKPDFLRRDQSLEADAAALKQDLEAYNQRALTAALSLRRILSPRWTARVGIFAEREDIAQEGLERRYTLAALPFVAIYDGTGLTNPLQDPTHGVRARLTATPTLSVNGGLRPFAILEGSAATYIDLNRFGLTPPGRSIIALRGLLGSIAGAGQFDVPPDQRFYAGGSATVRGFKYQSVGPLFPDGTPIGGTAIDAATVEFRQRLFGDFGAAGFVDAGQVGAGNRPFAGTLRIGAGVGLRYYTAIGPIRLDIAVPVNPIPGGDAFELYLGLGQAF
jgi:translocation and assembly module TamA